MERCVDMRLASLSFLMALGCGGSGSPPPETAPTHTEPAPEHPSVVANLCRDLSSPDLQVRAQATRDIMPLMPEPVSGGTEQQMEAAQEFCLRETGVRPTLGSPPEADEGCFEACVQRRRANGESQEDSEGQCMQDCNDGE